MNTCLIIAPSLMVVAMIAVFYGIGKAFDMPEKATARPFRLALVLMLLAAFFTAVGTW